MTRLDCTLKTTRLLNLSSSIVDLRYVLMSLSAEKLLSHPAKFVKHLVMWLSEFCEVA